MKKKSIINLIRYHVEKNDAGFKAEAYDIAKDFELTGDSQLSAYIMSMLSNADALVPQLAELESPFLDKISSQTDMLLLPDLITKDILAGPPQRISQKLDLTLILGDIVEDKVFSRKTISVIGVGTSEEKSFISAFKNIKPNNKDIALFMQDGKQKILDFYQTHCQDIIAEARDLANRELFEH